VRGGHSVLLAGALALLCGCQNEPAGLARRVSVAAGIDHAAWDRLLKTYVDERGLVDYGALKAASADRRALAEYLERLAAPAEPPAQGADLAASLVNGYNATVVAWILDHYPTGSIRAMKDSFTAPRHRFGGRPVSLDAIEHQTLRPRVGFRVHAALVCAARSCPPLARQAYTPADLEEQLDLAMQRWLSRSDLNRFEPASGRVRLSLIFKWFAPDFDRAGGVAAVLRRYGPPDVQQAARGPLRIEYLPYDWSLNDQGQAGAAYGGLQLFWDRVRALLP
jgi:uncharacterized protein DUF547